MRLITFTRAVLATAVVFALVAPTPAHAQFGRLIKKAKDKVAAEKDTSAAASTESAGAPAGALRFGAPKFDADVIELTPAVLDRVMRGMSVEVSALKKNAVKGKQISDDIEAANKEYDHIASQHPDEERQAWQESNDKINQCLDAALDKLKEQRQGEAQARLMGDPEVRKKMMELSQKASASAQSGDTVASQKIMVELEALVYPYAKEDSVTARKECGTPPAKSAWLVRQEELSERRSDLASQLRDLDGQARDTAIVATGGAGARSAELLTPRQYSLALERLVAWAAATEPGSRSGASYARLARYSPTELEAMKAKESELRGVAGELRDFHVWR